VLFFRLRMVERRSLVHRLWLYPYHVVTGAYGAAPRGTHGDYPTPHLSNANGESPTPSHRNYTAPRQRGTLLELDGTIVLSSLPPIHSPAWTDSYSCFM
jgi:hypothetical protein